MNRLKLIALFALGLTSCERPENRYLGRWEPIGGNHDGFEIHYLPRSSDPAVYYGAEYIMLFNKPDKSQIDLQYFTDADLMIGATSKTSTIYRMDCKGDTLKITYLQADKTYQPMEFIKVK